MARRTRARSVDLRQLECFCAVARAGSFTKAAEDPGIAQPSLSEQIAKL
ncbi:MAG: LysR family transcriptional regulator [Bryobacteraceae bacterium]